MTDKIAEAGVLKRELKIFKPELKNPKDAKEAEDLARTGVQELVPVLEHAKSIEVVDQITYSEFIMSLVTPSRMVGPTNGSTTGAACSAFRSLVATSIILSTSGLQYCV